MASGLHVVLIGEITICRNGERLTGVSAKPLELLCYLLLHPRRAHTRESLADLLWPDASRASLRKYLRQTPWQLQASLAADAPPEDVALLDCRPDTSA